MNARFEAVARLAQEPTKRGQNGCGAELSRCSTVVDRQFGGARGEWVLGLLIGVRVIGIISGLTNELKRIRGTNRPTRICKCLI